LYLNTNKESAYNTRGRLTNSQLYTPGRKKAQKERNRKRDTWREKKKGKRERGGREAGKYTDLVVRQLRYTPTQEKEASFFFFPPYEPFPIPEKRKTFI